jgi:hypothetical protein
MAVPKLLTLWTNEILGPNRKIAAYWQSGLMDTLKEIDMEAAVQAETFLVNSCPMSDGRAAYTVTLLPGGKELIAGGYLRSYVPSVTNRDLSKAEIYDPNSRQWTETGQMNAARCGHRATLLPDGKVLIEGGFSFGGVEPPHTLASAELIDIYGVTKGIQSDVGFVVFSKSTGLFRYSPYEERFIPVNLSSGKIDAPEKNK